MASMRAALPGLRAGCAHGRRGERGIFLGFHDHGERESIVFEPVREDFLPPPALQAPIAGAVDSAARPTI